MMTKLKWTIKGRLEIVYTGTLKNMSVYTGWAELDGYGRGECFNGVKIGAWEYFHKTGQLMLREGYDEHGLRHGYSRSFHLNGQLDMEEYYENGKLSGESSFYWEDGSLHKKISHTPEGYTSEVKSYYEGTSVLHMHQLFERYQGKKGWRTRLLKEVWYHENGALWVESRYRNGVLVEEIRP